MKKQQYIITDPCYLLPNDVWSNCCEVFNQYSSNEMYERFNEKVAEALTKLTGYPAYACDTGFDDWTNEIYGTGIIKRDFFADAGMACVCRYTDKIKQHLETKYPTNPFAGAAIFEMSEDISVDFDVSNKNWTVIHIQDNLTGDDIYSVDEDNEDYYEEDDFENEDE